MGRDQGTCVSKGNYGTAVRGSMGKGTNGTAAVRGLWERDHHGTSVLRGTNYGCVGYM